MKELVKYKIQISKKIEDFLDKKIKSFLKINEWGKISLEQLKSFSTSGKMIRGMLICFGNEISNNNITDDTFKTAAALELFHSSLLIHDDIMDHDEFRRGKKTIPSLYKNIANKRRLTEPKDFGNSMGICVGDLGYFLGFELLTEIEDKTKIPKLIKYFSKELNKVGLAQMQDIHLTKNLKILPKETTYLVYRYKTARYTFSLPLMLGTILGNREDLLNDLAKLGEELGLIFQLKDDELGIFSNNNELGKIVGSDIKEKKKTIYYHYLFTLSKNKEKLNSIFGNKNITNKDIEFVKSEIINLKINNIVNNQVNEHKLNAEKIIKSLDIDEKYKIRLNSLLKYNLTRKK